MISTASFYASHLAGPEQAPVAAELLGGYKMSFLLSAVVAAIATACLLISLILRRGRKGNAPIARG